MKRLDFPANSQFPDALPDGSYIVGIRDSHIESSVGRIELPTSGNNVLYPRFGPTGRFAGGGNRDDAVWEWTGSQWVSRPHQSSGMHPTIYDRGGTLHCSELTPMGYRQISDLGTIVGCQETYSDPVRGINEYTTLGNITVGQGPESGLIALVSDPTPPVVGQPAKGKRYLVAEGDARFINFTRDGDKLALAWHSVLSGGRTEAHLLWLTVAELATFPEDTTWPPPPPAPPDIAFTLDQAEVVTPPGVVTGVLTTKTNVKTWRWLYRPANFTDYVIDQPIDGDTHTFQFSSPFVYEIAVRASGDGGVVQTPPQRVVVEKAAITIPFHVLCAGLFGDDWLAHQLVETGWKCIRTDFMPRPDGDMAIWVPWAKHLGLDVLALIGPEQVDDCVDYGFVEMMDFRGAYPEPDLRHVDPIVYANAVNKAMPKAREKHLTVYAGCANLAGNEDKLPWWSAFAKALDADVKLSPHRYPPNNKSWNSVYPGYVSRADEIAKWATATGARTPSNPDGRAWLMSEWGWNTGKWYSSRWQEFLDFFTGRNHNHLSEDTILQWTKQEFDFLRVQGADGGALYQINDAAEVIMGVALEKNVPKGSEAGTPFGIRFNTVDHNPWAPKPRAFAPRQ